MSPIQKRNLINGVWISGDEETENLNPSDSRDIIGHFARADAALVDDAIAAADAVGHAWGVGCTTMVWAFYKTMQKLRGGTYWLLSRMMQGPNQLV
jgi:acyl-CoA reductase-like NAD-dependent aldehyde dehydrogenase